MADDRPDGNPMDDFEEWKRHAESGDISPKETYSRISNIALLLSYDLIDKLRFLEKEVGELDDEEVVERVAHMMQFVDKLRAAYLDFAETEL